jgi:hypothetical protein
MAQAHNEPESRLARERSGQAPPGFDPDRLAYLETAGWKAYYDHKWLLAFRLLVQLSHEQFGLSWLRSIQAAYYITRASIAWAPKENEAGKARRYIRKFYRVGAKHGRGLSFDPAKVADAEFRYWVVHRRLSGRPQEEKGPLVDSFAELHSAIFGIPKEQAYPSAVSRARAADTVDLITSKTSTDVAGDWQRVENHLREAYRSVKVELPQGSPPGLTVV